MKKSHKKVIWKGSHNPHPLRGRKTITMVRITTLSAPKARALVLLQSLGIPGGLRSLIWPGWRVGTEEKSISPDQIQTPYTSWKTNESPLKINGWKMCISYWNSPFIGDLLVFGGVGPLELPGLTLSNEGAKKNHRNETKRCKIFCLGSHETILGKWDQDP